MSPDLPGVMWTAPRLPNLGPEFEPLRGRPFVRDSAVFREPFTHIHTEDAGRWFSCPTAEVRRVSPVMQAYRLFRAGLGHGVERPSAALTEGLAVLVNIDIELDNAALREVTGG